MSVTVPSYDRLEQIASAEFKKKEGWVLITPRLVLELLEKARKYDRIAALTPESCKPKGRPE